MTKLTITSSDCLLVIDPQVAFCPGGGLPVPDGDAIIADINQLGVYFHHDGAVTAMSADSHPADHSSFARTHDMPEYSVIEMAYGEQTLWPPHAVVGSADAMFHDAILEMADLASVIVRKGQNPEIDSYSAFFENDRKTSTGLGALLAERGVKRIFLAGLAYDFCVGFSALDAVRLGFDAYVIKDLCRGIDIDGSVAAMEAKFLADGVKIIHRADIAI